MRDSEIVALFAKADYLINKDALELIKNEFSSERICRFIESLDDSVFVVCPEHIKSIYLKSEHAVKPPQIKDNKPLPPMPEILMDITNKSTCIGEYEEFVCYFRDRYSKISNMLRRTNPRPIESLKKRNLEAKEPVSIVGMVSDIRTTNKGHRRIDLEDPTGKIPVIITKDGELSDTGKRIILDEVIGITGKLSQDGSLLIANGVTWPDIPNQQNTVLGKKTGTGKVVFISDIHVGSKTFLEDSWLRFIDWLKEDSENIRYLIIAGDVVDGIGIYPNQEKELAIMDVYEQYAQAARYIREIPGHIRIIIAPGNHDAVRQAEPQPKFPEKIRAMFGANTVFVGNPCMIEIEGTKILIYHGRSIDDFVASLPGFTYSNPTKSMIEMLKRRHISPVYGGRVSIAPEKEDHFVIDTVPDILHCGHVHTVGVEKYRNVLAINSGTWQSQTEFQKRMNLQPMPAIATMVDLNSMTPCLLPFGKNSADELKKLTM